jgi:two-component system, NtrC family, nitrogen regulation sensor histidine kinase GlnL
VSDHGLDLRRVLDAVPDGIVVVDRAARVTLVNGEACRILGISEESALGEALSSLEATRGTLANRVDDAIASGRGCVVSEHRSRGRYASDIMLDISVSPLGIENHGGGGAVIAMRDRTIRHALERQFSERERLGAFGLMAAGIAHEIKNPLGGIRGAAEILAARAHDGKTGETALLIVREVSRITALVDELMVFARGGEMELARLNIHRVLDEVLELVSLDALAAGVRIERRFDPSLPELQGDAGRLSQVFINLTRNALQALGGRGTLAVETRMAIDHRVAVARGRSVPTLAVCIEDDGPGMSPELLEAIATPLFTTRADGAGLGLAVARHWVTQHGGTLRIDSAPGEGTRAIVNLPLQRDACGSQPTVPR